jgi:polyhydroxyalkanoate synthesis regulator phasin
VIEIEEYTKKYNESQRFLATTSQELNHLKNKYEELNLKRSTEILQENPEITVLRQRVKTLEK